MCQGDCCYYVPLPHDLWEKYKHMAQVESVVVNWENGEINFREEPSRLIIPLTEDMRCPFLNRTNFKCMIYENRPMVCKLFGTSEEKGFACFFMKPNGKLRNKKERKKRQKENEEQLNKIAENINRGGEILAKIAQSQK